MKTATQQSIDKINVLRFDVIVPNVWDYLMSDHVSTIASYQNRVGGFAKESKVKLIEEHFFPYKVQWQTSSQYFDSIK